MNVVRGSYIKPTYNNRFPRKPKNNTINRTIDKPSFRGKLKSSVQKTPRYLLTNGSLTNNNSTLRTSNTRSFPVIRSGSYRDIPSRGNITISSVQSKNSSVTPRYRIIGQGNSGPRATPGSVHSNTPSNFNSFYILAISEGRGAARGEVGIAAIDLRTLHLSLSQISDSHSYIHTLTKVHFYNPVEIIVPHTFSSGIIPTELYKLIKDQFPKITVTSIPRRQFSSTAGLQKIQQLCAPEYESVTMLITYKFYSLTATAAVLSYVEHIQCIIFAPRSMKIEYHATENFTLIDMETAVKLELVEPLSENTNRGSSLLSILNYTLTLGGSRNLRANILQPLCNLKAITTRLDCIEELKENEDGIMTSLESIIKQLYDIEKILWLCILSPSEDGSRAGEAQLNHILLLKTSMDLVPNIAEALKSAKSDLLSNIRKDLESPRYEEMLNKIKTVLQENVHAARGAAAHMQRCFAVKPEINGLLDVARRTYSELIIQIEDKVAELSETYGMPLRLNSNATRGFHIVMPLPRGKSFSKQVENLPPIFFDVQHNGASLSMTTEEIVLLNQQTTETLNEIHCMSNLVIYGLLTDLRPFMGLLYKLCEHVAELDLLLSLTKASLVEHYVRPDFNNYLELVNSVHPMLDYILPVQPVPNDVFASSEFNFSVITGPNMGGKSIYIKQIALLQIMSQIGCYVPATKATFRIADRIFSRLSFNDSIELNASTFVLEMKEIDYILKNITPKSLVIIDELCRSTSSEEGTSLAWAISEKLLNTEAFTFFTTHFLYLTKLQDMYLNVVNLQTDTDEIISETRRELIYKHKIIAGVTSVEQYGLTLARNTNLPQKVLDLAGELATVIAKYKKHVSVNNATLTMNATLHRLVSRIKLELADTNANDHSLDNIVKKFKEDHPDIIQNLIQKETPCAEKECTPIQTPNIEKALDEDEPIQDVEPNENEQTFSSEKQEDILNCNIDTIPDHMSIIAEYDDVEIIANEIHSDEKPEHRSSKSIASPVFDFDDDSVCSTSDALSELNMNLQFDDTPTPKVSETAQNQSDSCWILEASLSKSVIEDKPIRNFNFSPVTTGSINSNYQTPDDFESELSDYSQFLQEVLQSQSD